ncbi:MAG TPA: hypothetical protein VJ772_02415 [Nitrososphaeraceae archaeon]|nr:hypothetical protein [Nitrososphaeraceae archaeon]
MNPTITDIDPEKLEQLKLELETIHTSTFKIKNALIKKYVGTCVSCYDIPSKIVTYDVGDAKKVERYCSKHFVQLLDTSGNNETVAIRDRKSRGSKNEYKSEL